MRVRTLEATPFGPVAIVWTLHDDGPKVVRVLLSKPGTRGDERARALFPETRGSTTRGRCRTGSSRPRSPEAWHLREDDWSR